MVSFFIDFRKLGDSKKFRNFIFFLKYAIEYTQMRRNKDKNNSVR